MGEIWQESGGGARLRDFFYSMLFLCIKEDSIARLGDSQAEGLKKIGWLFLCSERR
jgi:hypothetical protein